MIAAVATAAQRQAFLEAARRDPMLHAVLGRDLTLWAGNSGAPVQLYLAGGAALSLSDGCAWMSGLPDDPEELHSFWKPSLKIASSVNTPKSSLPKPTACRGSLIDCCSLIDANPI